MKDQHDLAEGWFRKADSDLSAIGALIEVGTAYDAACFHAQQAIEKYLKGFIELKETVAPKIHDLVELNQLCSELGAEWAIDAEILAEMTNYAVRSRYEVNFYPSKATATRAFDQAQQICETVLATQKRLKEASEKDTTES